MCAWLVLPKGGGKMQQYTGVRVQGVGAAPGTARSGGARIPKLVLGNVLTESSRSRKIGKSPKYGRHWLLPYYISLLVDSLNLQYIRVQPR